MESESNSLAAQAGPLPGRRTFFQRLTYALGAVAAAAAGIPLIAYLFGPRKAPVEWFPLGPVVDFPENHTRRVTFSNPIRQPWDGMVANTAVYVRYEGQVGQVADLPSEVRQVGNLPHAGQNKTADETLGYKFLVLAANCAHLGCPVEWFQESGLFMCPCHGGVYYANGERASGPPPRGLFRCVYRVRRIRELDVLEIQAPHFPTLQDTLQQPA